MKWKFGRIWFHSAINVIIFVFFKQLLRSVWANWASSSQAG